MQVHTPGDKQQILGLLIVKELVLLDPDDKVTFSSRSTCIYGHCLGAIVVWVRFARLFHTRRSTIMFCVACHRFASTR